MPEQILAGKYVVQSEIAKGGMGIIYKALDRTLNRVVAIKQVHAHLSGDSSFVERFLREARAMARLQHDNIVTIYAVEEDRGIQLLVMEYFQGRNLRELTKNRPRLPLRDIVSITQQLANALAFAHAHGIIHRDIKPANVMVDKRGKTKLTDFGIAAALDEAAITSTGQFIGTPEYMSPEQACGTTLDGRSDLYSVGIMLYEMLTGKTPYAEASKTSIIGKLAFDQQELSLPFPSDVPSLLQEVVLNLLRRQPEERIPDADTLATQLHEILYTLPASPAVPPSSESDETLGASLPTGANAPTRAEPDPPTAIGPGDPTETHIAQSVTNKSAGLPPPTTTPRSSAPSNLDETTVLHDVDETRVFTGVSTVMLSGDAASAIRSSADKLTQIMEIRGGALTVQFPKKETDEQSRPRVSVTFASAADPGLVGRSVPLTSIPFVIGRRLDANLTISSDPALSRSHCAIDWHEGAYVVRNLDSKNGLWVDGCAVRHDTPQPLLSGTALRLSDKTVLTLVFSDVHELPDLSGTAIEGRYKLISQIRSSSKAANYMGQDLRLPRLVAIKILSPTLAAYPGYLDELNREAKTAVQLHHPHIAGVVDFGSTNMQVNADTLNLHYVCMEYMEGGSLAKRISDLQLQTPAQVSEWLDPVASALDYAHRNGVVHSGLKTTSIVFDGEGKPYVTDFASATHSESSNLRMVLGSPDFLAPEQWEDLRPTYATDQYALAVLVYLALCGVPPFDEQQNPSRRERNFLRGAVPVHEEVRRQANIKIPESISAVVAKGMAVKPKDRYPSLREFSLAFRHAMSEPKTPRKASPEVFFSYRRDTGAAWAALFSRELERQGISVFVDTQRRDNVVRFPAWLENAIQNCDIFVCLLSEKTLDSTWVQHEIQTAFALGKPMIPIIQEDFKFPIADQSLVPHIDALLTYQGVPLLDRKGVYFDAAIAEVAKMVHAYVSKKLK